MKLIRLLLVIALLHSSTMLWASQINTAKLHQQNTVYISKPKEHNSRIAMFPNMLSWNKTEALSFWITLVVAAIGVYSIYGFAAGIIAVAITYFATKGNKKAFRLSILGCVIGCVIGGLLRLGYMMI